MIMKIFAKVEIYDFIRHFLRKNFLFSQILAVFKAKLQKNAKQDRTPKKFGPVFVTVQI